MTASKRWPSVKELFGEAMERPASQRTAFVLSRCSDPDVLHEVHRLLQCDKQSPGFLSQPLQIADETKALLEATLRAGDFVGPEGRYRIERLIGRGGMCGGVYEAFDRELEIRVALKVISDSSEFLAARHVTHPNVCRVYDCGRDRGLRYLTMELLEGETLEQRLHSRGPLRAAELESLIRQLCDGLGAAHDAGVLHRDLKPGNVFLTTSGRVVLTDFGLAHGGGNCATSRQFIGTLPYMAPELFAGRKASDRSDVYSLGVLLCEAATGKLPFEGAVPPARWRRLMQEMTQADPSKRPASVSAIARSIGKGLLIRWNISVPAPWMKLRESAKWFA